MRKTQSRIERYRIGEIMIESYGGVYRIIFDGIKINLVKREITQILAEDFDVEKMRENLSTYEEGIRTLPKSRLNEIFSVFEEIINENLEQFRI